MIPLTATVCQDTSQNKNQKSEAWQTELAQAYRSPEELLSALGLVPDQIPGGITTHKDFPLRVPRGFVARMESGNPHDPLLLQVLSRQIENASQPGFNLDPVGDGPATAIPGLLHKYQGRVLLITTGACPIHCRYCFRRHFPYSDNRPSYSNWSAALDYIASDNSISEVILSGGDPLSLSNDRLQGISAELRNIPHLQRLRIHTRMPIVLPERINLGFKTWLETLPWQTILVTHCNHANEIDNQVKKTLSRLKSTGITLLNQAVLLRGVNDNATALIALCETLYSSGVLPYYLHLLDRVQGAAHYEIPRLQAVELMKKLQASLPGYLVPRLVREQAGYPHKIPILDLP